MTKHIHIVSVSGGASSAATFLRVCECYPAASIYPVFADTNWEDEDLYRFVDDLEYLTGIPIHRINNGLKPSDISEQQKMIFNSRIANCTIELKVKPIERYVARLQSEHNPHRTFMHIGFNIGDRYKKARKGKPYGRLPGPVANWKEKNVTVKYPLWFYPRVTDVQSYVESYGLTLPRAYLLRQQRNDVTVTNNCGGGCFKAGQKYWRGLLIMYPDRFDERMRWENKMRQNPKYANYAILTKQENGVKRAYPLSELKADTLAIIDDKRALRRAMLEDDLESVCVDECQVY